MENLLKIAKASKSDGTDGAVVFSFLSIAPEDLEISEPVFVYFDGLPVPFFIESFVRKGTSKAVVRLNDIRSYEDAEELVGKDIYIEDDGEYEEEMDFVGWTVMTVASAGDDNSARTGKWKRAKSPAATILGKVTDFLDIPGNPCIEVMPNDSTGASDVHKDGTGGTGTKKGAVIIPLHEDFIVSADSETLTLVMSLPEGLL